MAELLFEEQQREIVAELNDEAGPELSRDVDFDEADVGAGEDWVASCGRRL